MLDIKFLRENPEIVKENIKKKFQDAKLPLVDEVIELDAKVRALKLNPIQLRIAGLYSRRNDTVNVPYIQRTNEFTPEEARINNKQIVVYKTLRRED